MAIEIVTYFHTLCRLAREEAEARMAGDPEELARAIRAHEDYRQAVLASDSMIIARPQ
jgi:hypothetical protein